MTKYARFSINGTISYGVVEEDTIHAFAGGLLGDRKPTGKSFPLSSVMLLAPVEPSKILAMAGNYRNHLPEGDIPPKFKIPQLFYKPSSCLAGAGENIVIPKGTADVHYEAELVLVIGKSAKNVATQHALEYVFGATCGNDVSARDWQKSDVQWWRAKGCDSFGPCGPFVVSGLNYDNLGLQLRLNGQVKQKDRTSDMIHNVATMVSVCSQHTTLNPGDIIFTGTPGKTSAIKPGDVCEVEIEGIGVLRNPVVAVG